MGAVKGRVINYHIGWWTEDKLCSQCVVVHRIFPCPSLRTTKSVGNTPFVRGNIHGTTELRGASWRIGIPGRNGKLFDDNRLDVLWLIRDHILFPIYFYVLYYNIVYLV